MRSLRKMLWSNVFVNSVLEDFFVGNYKTYDTRGKFEMMKAKSLAKRFLGLSAFCLCFSVPTATFAAVTGSADVRVYIGRLDKYETLKIYHTDRQPTVPYVSAVEYLGLDIVKNS